MGSDQEYIRSFIMASAIVFTPMILIISGLVLRKFKKKISKWLLIIGGSLVGLLAVVFALVFFGEMFCAIKYLMS